MLCFALLAATATPLPMVWDEGNAIHRADGIARWARRWRADAAVDRPLSNEAIVADWRYTTSVEGHPAFYGIVIAAGRGISPSFVPPLTAARVGTMLLFSLAAGVMVYRVLVDYSAIAGWAAFAALLTMPRLFAHAHFATCDGPLTACWILSWATFAPTVRGRWWMAMFWGICLGATMSCKFTGWFAPLPFIGWAILFRERAALRTLAIGLPVALLTFYLLNPPLWHQPLDGMRSFLELNLGRADHPARNIRTVFLGRYHDLRHSLPWYNTLLWTEISVPVGTLVMAAIGVISILKHARIDQFGPLLALNWATLMVVRALPWAPPHDAERLFLPSFAFLAALAGVGCHHAVIWLSRWRSTHALRWRAGLAAIGVSFVAATASTWWYAPQWLSYYNELIGGLRGATALGMEPTYYWDSLDSEVLDWLHANTPPGDKVSFANGPPENLELLRQWNILRRDYMPDAAGEYRWHVVQRRPSFLTAADAWLIDNEQPAFQKTIRPPDVGWGPWRLDVPLLDVYPYEANLQAQREAFRAAAPIDPPADAS